MQFPVEWTLPLNRGSQSFFARDMFIRNFPFVHKLSPATVMDKDVSDPLILQVAENSLLCQLFKMPK